MRRLVTEDEKMIRDLRAEIDSAVKLGSEIVGSGREDTCQLN